MVPASAILYRHSRRRREVRKNEKTDGRLRKRRGGRERARSRKRIKRRSGLFRRVVGQGKVHLQIRPAAAPVTTTVRLVHSIGNFISKSPSWSTNVARRAVYISNRPNQAVEDRNVNAIVE